MQYRRLVSMGAKIRDGAFNSATAGLANASDGSVTVPEVLRPYMGGVEKLVPETK